MQRQRLGLWVPVVAAMAMAGCAPIAVGEQVDLSGRITQTLESGITPTPIAGASVRFTSDVGDVVTTTTDSSGRYEMQFISGSTFGQVRAEAAGFVASERTVFFDAPARRIDIGLRPDTMGMMP